MSINVAAELSGPDFLDAVADAEEANGNTINAAVFRERAKQWQRDIEAAAANEEPPPPADPRQIPGLRSARSIATSKSHAITPTDHRK